MKTIFLWILLTLFCQQAAFTETINGAGATFPYPLYSVWAYAYQKATGTRINFQSIGSGGGQRQIFDRTVQFGASDDPLPPELLQKHNLLQFPVVIGGVVPVINIPGIPEGALKLDADTLSRIFLGIITYWDDEQIKNLNKDLKLPHEKITVIYRTDPSGSTALFTHFLNDTSPEWQDKVGTGKAVAFPVGLGGKGSEGLAAFMQRTDYSIGYIELAYALQNHLNYAQLKNDAGNFVAPTFQTFQSAAENAGWHSETGFYYYLINTEGKNSWPIAGATFILLPKEKTASNKEVVKFFEWAFKEADAQAKELIYVPLPASLKEKVIAYWKANGLL